METFEIDVGPDPNKSIKMSSLFNLTGRIGYRIVLNNKRPPVTKRGESQNQSDFTFNFTALKKNNDNLRIQSGFFFQLYYPHF